MKETLKRSGEDEDHLENIIQLSWKFVTLPNPLIVCRPKNFDAQIHSPEYGHWDSKCKEELPLIYTRSVVYRDYGGVVASKGWVANTPISQQSKWLSDLKSKCLLS